MIAVRAVSVALVGLVATTLPVAVAHTEGAPQENYQIIRATPDRVWRLNTRTGEVAVCTLEAGHLICIPGVEAPKAPTQTYEQIEAEKARAAAEAEKQRQEEKAKSLKVLDQMFEAFRRFIEAATKADDNAPK